MEFFKKRSTAWAVLAIVIVVSFFIGQARGPGATPELETLPSGVYVQDTAGVLSSSTEKYITEMNNGLVSAVNAEIQVATVDTTGSKDIYDLAYELAVETNLSANCCVFVIAVDDVDALILQGDDLIYEFSDSELSAILNRNFTVRDFEKRNVDDAVRNSFADLIGMYENLYGVRITGSANIVKQSGSTSSYSSAFTVLMMILFIVLLIVVVMAITRPGRRRTVVVPTGHVGRTTPPRSGNYPPRGSYTTPPPYSSRSGGFGGSTKSKGGSFSSSSRSGGFGSSSRGGSFGSSSRSGGFGGSRGGSFGGGSRGGSFGGSRGGGFRK